MNFEKVVFAFLIILALSLNFGFFIGELDNPAHHDRYELFAAILATLACTILKFGDRTHFGSAVLATSLVALLQLVAAATVWQYAGQGSTGIDASAMARISSLAGGALVANLLSVVLLIIETSQIRK